MLMLPPLFYSPDLVYTSSVHTLLCCPVTASWSRRSLLDVCAGGKVLPPSCASQPEEAAQGRAQRGGGRQVPGAQSGPREEEHL
jgi:hypothetical protein